MTDNKFNTFCTLLNSANWLQYQDEAGEFLSNSKVADRIAFPVGPKSYPCLVATTYSSAEANEDSQFTRYRANCCFVYLNDAQRLLQAAASVNESVIVEDEDENEFVSSWQNAVTGVSNPGDAELTVLVLGMLKELQEIGAIDFERLMSTVPGVSSKLDEYGKKENQPEDIVEFFKELWAHINAS